MATGTSSAFTACSVLLPVVDETNALQRTVEIIEHEAASDVLEYLLLTSPITTAASRDVCEALTTANPGRFRIHTQSLPGLGGALREGFELARGSHVIMMASDLETDPAVVPRLIAGARARPDVVFTASRWLEGGGFSGYGPIKTVSNFVFQRLFSRLYRTHLTDMTYGYRLFPTALVRRIRWEELRHPFLFETVLKPLRLGVDVEEVPARWSVRPEGVSQGAPLRSLGYLRVGLTTLLRPVASLQK